MDIYDTVLDPYRVEELLPHSTPKRLGDVSVRTLEPTELLALKAVAAMDRRGSEKGAKDLADLLALLSAEDRTIAWDRIEERVPRMEGCVPDDPRHRQAGRSARTVDTVKSPRPPLRRG